jgi:aminoglycoside phosphotransferase (APT) family kinase protein
LQEALQGREAIRYLPAISGTIRGQLLSMLDLPAAPGWAHGDIQPASLLMDADHRLRTVVDFGLLHFGSSQEDLVDALISLCMTANQQFHLGRGRILLDAYDSLVPVRAMAWTPVVAVWLAQQIIHATQMQRALPHGFGRYLAAPESLATAIASCIC